MGQDRAYVQKKFSPSARRTVRHCGYQWQGPMSQELQDRVKDLAPNDAGLPAASASPAAAALETWCKQGSWALCRRCGSAQPQHLKEAAAVAPSAGKVITCKNCQKPEERRAWVPQPDEVPPVLRGLSAEQIRALRPLDIDSGPEWKAEFGYYFHSAMIRFSWSAEDVEDKIDALDRPNRKAAKKAFKFLVESDRCNYFDWMERHRKFLLAHPGADAERRKRPLRYIEEKGIETALWPHLYWDLQLCETTARLADVRRHVRSRAEENDEEDGAGADEQAGRQSLKRNFLLKALGPIADYAGEYELLHFVFDLSTWSDVGGKKGKLQGVPMWQAMKGAVWTPQYWKVRHAAALDMQAQCGYPVAFLTWAPFEWSAPYHQWLLRQMGQLGRQRLQLAGPEALHLAHLLTELFREWVCGGGRKFGDAGAGWRSSVFRGGKADGGPIKVNFVGRLEFQDGKRKEASQDYHGRGAVHLHGLVFAESIASMALHDKFSAAVPPEGHPLRGLVLDGQTSRTGSGWPIQEAASYTEAERVRLQHSREDKRLGVRGYSPEVLDVLKCHQDAQLDKGTGLMLKYAATYLPKFSDGPGKELMDDRSSGYAAARRVLFTYHPGEPEMWLTLANQQFPMFFLGGTMQPIVAPHPGMAEPPKYVQLYEAATWKGELSLLEFLRRVNGKGAILEHIRKARKKDPRGRSLELFAVQYRTFGKKVIAAEMVSMMNDKPLGSRVGVSVSR